MNRPLVEQIADAVLYEGYLLYPYRPSVKNRRRWTFGGLYPRSYSEARAGLDPWMSQTECLIEASAESRLGIRVRFLHLQIRRAECDVVDAATPPWQEAVERDVGTGEFLLSDMLGQMHRHEFEFPGCHTEAESPERGGASSIREQHAIAGCVNLSAERVADSLVKLRVQICNESAFPDDSSDDRDEALLRALVSTHAILVVRDGGFLSMIDPPEPCCGFAAGCKNIGTWPVLAGEPGSRDTMLSAPIILYDYPQVAPESPGDLFDGTEIDEILSLRILTLTDDEKRAMSGIDERARALLERTESLSREQWMGLHGTIRYLRPEGGPR
jgi:hydrogenase maturation protease